MERLINLLEWKSTYSKVDNKLAKGALIPRDISSTLGIDGIYGDAIILIPSTIEGEKIIDIPQVKGFTNKNGNWIASVLTIDSNGRPIDKPARVQFLNKDELISKFDAEPFNLEEATEESNPEDAKTSSANVETPVETDTYDYNYNAHIDDCYTKVCSTLHSLLNVHSLVESKDNTENVYEIKSEKTDAEVVLTYNEPDFLIRFINEAKEIDFTTSAALLGYDDAADDASKIVSMIIKAINKNDVEELKLTPMAVLDRFDAFLKFSSKVGFTVEKNYRNYIDKYSKNNKLIIKHTCEANNFPNSPQLNVEVHANSHTKFNEVILIAHINDEAGIDKGEIASCERICNYTDMLRFAMSINDLFVEGYKQSYPNLTCLNPSMPIGLYSYVPKHNFRLYKVAEYIRESLKNCDYIASRSVSDIKDLSFNAQNDASCNSLYYVIECNLAEEKLKLKFILEDNFSNKVTNKSVSFSVIDENNNVIVADELLNNYEIDNINYRKFIDSSLEKEITLKLKIKLASAAAWVKNAFGI